MSILQLILRFLGIVKKNKVITHIYAANHIADRVEDLLSLNYNKDSDYMEFERFMSLLAAIRERGWVVNFYTGGKKDQILGHIDLNSKTDQVAVLCRLLLLYTAGYLCYSQTYKVLYQQDLEKYRLYLRVPVGETAERLVRLLGRVEQYVSKRNSNATGMVIDC